MISFDTNILLKRVRVEAPDHGRAKAFFDGLGDREDVAINEWALLELYVLLRNPVVVRPALGAGEAAKLIERLRSHPRWACLGFPGESRQLHDELWGLAGTSGFARRRVYDLRMGLSLRRLGVTEFATANVKDFQDLGFRRVWNPLEEPEP